MSEIPETIELAPLLDTYIHLHKIISQLEEEYKRLPYRTSEDKRRQERWKGKIQAYWHQSDGLSMACTRAGVSLRELAKIRREEENADPPGE